MNDSSPFGATLELEVVKVKQGKIEKVYDTIVTEVPFTIIANDLEIATIACSPVHLKELAYGFLFSSGLIRSCEQIHSYACDTARWVAYLTLEETPDLSLFKDRLYTPGCGRGVMYANVSDMMSRTPLENDFSIAQEQVIRLTEWLQKSSTLYRSTGGVHTAALSEKGEIPLLANDDIGRHNAVDKVIGSGMLSGAHFPDMVLISSGRVSSEILHKAKKCGIPVLISRGAPTHQTVFLAREMGITVIGFARGTHFTIYSHEKRVR